MKCFNLIIFLIFSLYFNYICGGSVDVWIAGSGVLGTLIIKELKQNNLNLNIVTETLTTKRHSLLKSLGTTPIQRSERYFY